MSLTIITGMLISLFTLNAPLAPTALKPGDTAIDFKLKNVDGKMVSLADFKSAKGFIVVFTCNHCPYAKMYEDRLIALNDKYSKMGYPVIAINPNDPTAEPEDSFDEMKKRAKSKGFKFPYLFDEGQKIYPQYGATRTPHVFLLNAQRIVKYIGAIDDNPNDASAVKAKYLEEAIASLQAGKEIIPNVTKALGCSIKVKKA
ncbi:MAG TPA: thioredoxin family protein [Saprospiraceae bacterium]|nr:thioredoxin family protein [Saprospiraceae bacterium]HRG20922.1 thioredoxin family protein [Saprospiraceae bacterium]